MIQCIAGNMLPYVQFYLACKVNAQLQWCHLLVKKAVEPSVTSPVGRPNPGVPAVSSGWSGLCEAASLFKTTKPKEKKKFQISFPACLH